MIWQLFQVHLLQPLQDPSKCHSYIVAIVVLPCPHVSQTHSAFAFWPHTWHPECLARFQLLASLIRNHNFAEKHLALVNHGVGFMDCGCSIIGAIIITFLQTVFSFIGVFYAVWARLHLCETRDLWAPRLWVGVYLVLVPGPLDTEGVLLPARPANGAPSRNSDCWTWFVFGFMPRFVFGHLYYLIFLSDLPPFVVFGSGVLNRQHLCGKLDRCLRLLPWQGHLARTLGNACPSDLNLYY